MDALDWLEGGMRLLRRRARSVLTLAMLTVLVVSPTVRQAAVRWYVARETAVIDRQMSPVLKHPLTRPSTTR